MSTHVSASTPEEREKYANIEWQYGPEWLKKNVRWEGSDGSQQQS